MAPSYKLIYFNFTGRGEPIRMLLTYGGIPFEDIRFEVDEWPKIKPTTPLGQVPILEIDGKSYTQTIPLCRYLGRLLKIDGKDMVEDLAIESAVEMIWDMLKTAYESKFEPQEERQKQLLDKLHGQMTVLLAKLEEDTKKNGYIAINRISWADLIFLCGYEDLENILAGENTFVKYPNLLKLKKKLLENKNIREYLQKRPANPLMTAYSLKNDL
ncbi:unnamed protein product [Psylliodes chrysocephalus]|uniref:glutathione transferase n=1 Tax=Psylliodes chrysocephalus TaxID=3402493 RepID=A0A9P0CJN4_9CUCU|nr:unnamed protein product [Psylliodes chrysocephala]